MVASEPKSRHRAGLEPVRSILAEDHQKGKEGLARTILEGSNKIVSS